MSNWIKASDQLPPENVGVLVFIPGEDNHVTAGMWDVSKKWVLLDEYRVPTEQVTYWMVAPELPEDREYERTPARPEEEDTVIWKIRALQKRILELEIKCRFLCTEIAYRHIQGPIMMRSRSISIAKKNIEEMYIEFCG